MARRTKEEAQETRNLILDTAEKVFSENGVTHTSLSDIATAAELTRGAIYWHFKNKCDLFTAMMDRALLPLDELLATTMDSREPFPLKRLREVLVDCLADVVRNPRRRTVVEILLLKWEHNADMQPVIDRKRVNIKNVIDSMQKALDNAVSKKQLPPCVDTRSAAHFLHALILGSIMDQLMLPDRIDIIAEAPRLIDAYLDTLRLSTPRSALATGHHGPAG